MKTIPYTKMDAVIKSMPESKFKTELMRSYAKDILLQKDPQMTFPTYKFIASALLYESLCIFMREQLIDALNYVVRAEHNYPSEVACLMHLKEYDYIDPVEYIACKRLLDWKKLDELIKYLNDGSN